MSDLPENWVLAPIGSLCTLFNGRAFKPSDWKDKGLPIVRIQNLNNRKASYNYFDKEVDDRFLLNGGELLFAWSGTPGTSFGAHVWHGGKAVLNQHIFRVDFDESLIDKRFFRYAINQKLNELIGVAHGGVGLRHVTKGVFENTEIVVPPFDEQKRIAEKLDSLLARVDSCQSHLERVPQILKRFRQSVLAAATSGRLTEEWREERGVNGEWEESTFGETGSVSGGLTKNQKRNLIEWRKPYLRVANVYANKLELEDVAEIGLTQTEFEKTRLLKDDLLIVEGNGSLEQIGRAAIWNNEIVDCVHQNHIIRWRTNGNVIPKFALFWLLSPEGRSFMVGIASSTTGLHTLSISKVSSIPIRVPSPEEQAEIVRRVEKLFAYAERLEARYYSASEQVERLTPSLLAKAFRGELVEQDAGDESAEELVERIREAREEVELKETGPRRKRTVHL